MNRQPRCGSGEAMRHYITFHRFICQSNIAAKGPSETRNEKARASCEARAFFWGETAGRSHGTSLCAAIPTPRVASRSQHKSPSATDDFGHPTSVAQGLLPCRTRGVAPGHGTAKAEMGAERRWCEQESISGRVPCGKPHPGSGWCAGVPVAFGDPAVACIPLLSLFQQKPYSWRNGLGLHWSI